MKQVSGLLRLGVLLGLLLTTLGCPRNERRGPVGPAFIPGFVNRERSPQLRAFHPPEETKVAAPAKPSDPFPMSASHEPSPTVAAWPPVNPPPSTEKPPYESQPVPPKKTEVPEENISLEAAVRHLKAAGATISASADDEQLIVDFSQTKVGDEAIAWLRQVPGVQQLDLSGTRISDEGLARLSDMLPLEFLNLAQTEIGDRGIEPLMALPKLKYVILNGTKVTDRSLSMLAKSSSLEGVSLMETAVSAKAIEALKTLRPNCTIISRVPANAKAEQQPEPEEQRPAALPAAPEPAAGNFQQAEQSHIVQTSSQEQFPRAKRSLHRRQILNFPTEKPNSPGGFAGATTSQENWSDTSAAKLTGVPESVLQDPEFLKEVSEIYGAATRMV